MDEQQWQQWFERIWADREERIYRAFFGDTGPGIYNLQTATFKSLGQPNPDPRYLTHGVLECPPTDTHNEWIYVSSGMSNPWGEDPEKIDPAKFSGLGFEMTMHTRAQAPWAVKVLHYLMAVQLLVAGGEVEGQLIEPGDRIPLGGPLVKKEGRIKQLLVLPPPEPPQGYPASFQLASGRVDLLLVVGVSDREAEFARTQGAESLVTIFRHHGVFPLTDPDRVEVL